MGGGIISLVAIGIPDLYISGDPQITFFKVVYRRPCEFSMVDYVIKISSDPQPGDTHMINIAPVADKLNKICLVVDVPTPELEMVKPTVDNIQQVGNNYNLNLTFPSNMTLKDKVSYDNIFNDDSTSIGSQITTATNNLNTEYNSRLDILSYISSSYAISNNQYLGKYIAMYAPAIDFNAYGQNIDIQGYVMLTPQATRLLYHSHYQMIDLTEQSFMYYPDDSHSLTGGHSQPYTQSTNSSNTTTVTTTAQTIGSSDLSTPSTITNISSARFSTINKMMKIYPRYVAGYQKITSFQDILNITDIDASRYHIMIPINYLRQVQKRNILIRKTYLNSLGIQGATTDPLHQTTNITDDYLEQVKDTNLNDIIHQTLLFNNFNYNEMITTTNYELGLYKFEINSSVSDSNYPKEVTKVLDTGALKIPVQYIDKSSIKNQGSTQTVFNRFSINDNAIYDPLYEIVSTSDMPIWDISNQPQSGFLMLNVEDLDSNPTQQNIINITTDSNNNIIAYINPRYILCNDDKLGFSPHKIQRIWNHSIVKNININGQSGIVLEQVKIENVDNGATALVKLFEDIYTIPNVINSLNTSSVLLNS